MTSPHRRRLAALVVAAALVPSGARAQAIARSFEELQRTVTTGQTVFVTDKTGRQTKGKVADVSTSSLVILTPDTLAVPEGTVTEIRRADGLWKGALIGLGAGVFPGMLAGFAGCAESNEPGCVKGPIYGALIVGGISAAIGAGIDAAVNKLGDLVYLAPETVAVDPPRMERFRDPLWNGIGIGLAAGGGVGLATGLAAAQGVRSDFLASQLLAASLVIGVTLGGVTGLIIDALHKEQRAVYGAPTSSNEGIGVSVSPMLDTARRGVVASIRF